MYFKMPLFKVLKAKIAVDYSYGDTTDYTITWQTTYPIYWNDVFTEDDEISLIPKVNFYLGTQRYYTNFVKKPTSQKLKKLQQKNLSKASLDASSRFNLTGIYFSLPLSYSIGAWYFEASPNLTITTNQPKYEGKTPPLFNFILSVGVDF